MTPAPARPATRDIARTTLLLAFLCATAWAILPVLFVPHACGRWLRAIRGARPDGSSPLRASLLFGLLASAPGVCAYVAAADAMHDGVAALPRVLAASALLPVMLAPFVRAPLLLAAAEPAGSLVGSLRRSLLIAGAAPLRSLGLALLSAGATALPLALAHRIVQSDAGPIAIPVVLALWPLAWTPVLVLTSRATPEIVPPPTRSTLAALAALLVPGLLALACVGALAVREPLPVSVTRDGSGIQHTRGLQRSDRERGRLEMPGFRIDGARGRVRVRPRDGAPYEIVSAYDPSVARIEATPRGREAFDVTFEGPDWRMQIVLDADGRRLDDGMLDRSIARVGLLGTAALLAGIAAVIATLLVLARIAARARRASGAGHAHRLAGRLRLGHGATLESGTLTGDGSVVELLDGSAMLRLPDRLTPIGIEDGLARALDGAPVVVSIDRLPSFVTHRTATTPWPPTAQLVLGEPAAIEAQALARAARPIALMIGAGMTITSLALLAVCASA